MALITLLSDFGTRDGYVGAMKGILLARAPQAHLVDITHAIDPQDIAGAAWALLQACPDFPAGTIHLAVVDPGVGSERRPLLLVQQGQFFVGPDNGLFGLLPGAPDAAYCLDNKSLFRHPVSNTFHGRDIFASVAGHLAAGLPPPQVGSRIELSTLARLPGCNRLATVTGSRASGRVIHVDRFGNLVTNLQLGLDCAPRWQGQIGCRDLGPIRLSYADVDPGCWVAYVGSSGLVEVAVRNGSAVSLGGQQLLEQEVRLWRV